jgi:hypothetical protein
MEARGAECKFDIFEEGSADKAVVCSIEDSGFCVRFDEAIWHGFRRDRREGSGGGWRNCDRCDREILAAIVQTGAGVGEQGDTVLACARTKTGAGYAHVLPTAATLDGELLR